MATSSTSSPTPERAHRAPTFLGPRIGLGVREAGAQPDGASDRLLQVLCARQLQVDDRGARPHRRPVVGHVAAASAAPQVSAPRRWSGGSTAGAHPATAGRSPPALPGRRNPPAGWDYVRYSRSVDGRDPGEPTRGSEDLALDLGERLAGHGECFSFGELWRTAYHQAVPVTTCMTARARRASVSASAINGVAIVTMPSPSPVHASADQA